MRIERVGVDVSEVVLSDSRGVMTEVGVSEDEGLSLRIERVGFAVSEGDGLGVIANVLGNGDLRLRIDCAGLAVSTGDGLGG